MEGRYWGRGGRLHCRFLPVLRAAVLGGRNLCYEMGFHYHVFLMKSLHTQRGGYVLVSSQQFRSLYNGYN